MAKKKVVSHDQAFLDDIIAHPADDAPRLIYADWLQDHDQPHRAEFIRLQCRLATLPEDDPDRFALEERETQLLLVHSKTWRPDLPKWGRTGEEFPLHRGFLGGVSITATAFLKHGATLAAALPLQQVQLRNLSSRAAEIAASPLLARLQELEFHDLQVSAKTLRDLGASPHLGALERLSFQGGELSEQAARALAGWPVLHRLRRLQLPMLGEQALEVLAGTGRLTALERLELKGRPAAGTDLAALAGRAPALTHLILFGPWLTRKAVDALTQPGRLPALTALFVRGYNYIDELVESPLPEQLTSLELELEHTALSSAGLIALTAGSRLARMRRLVLKKPSVRSGVADLLAAAPLDALRHLTLSGVGLNADGLDRLVGSPRLAGLRELALPNNWLDDRGAVTLARSPHLANLKSLNLDSCHIGPAGAAALAASPHLARLQHLDLSDNLQLGDEGVRALADSPYLGELRFLDLSLVGMTEEGLRTLAHARGLGKLRRLYVCSNKFALAGPAVREFANPTCLPSLLSLVVDSWQIGSPGALTDLGRTLTL
jgi:uncharacterized protein (TIGR02996 family)